MGRGTPRPPLSLGKSLPGSHRADAVKPRPQRPAPRGHSTLRAKSGGDGWRGRVLQPGTRGVLWGPLCCTEPSRSRAAPGKGLSPSRSSTLATMCGTPVPSTTPLVRSSLQRGTGSGHHPKAMPSAPGGCGVWPRPAAALEKNKTQTQTLPRVGWPRRDEGSRRVWCQVRAQRPSPPPPRHTSQLCCTQVAPGQIFTTDMPVSFQFGLKRHSGEQRQTLVRRDLERTLHGPSESPVNAGEQRAPGWEPLGGKRGHVGDTRGSALAAHQSLHSEKVPVRSQGYVARENWQVPLPCPIAHRGQRWAQRHPKAGQCWLGPAHYPGAAEDEGRGARSLIAAGNSEMV